MEYHGKLYGKIGNKHFDTGVTSQDFDKLSQEHKEMFKVLKNVIHNFKSSDNHSRQRDLITQIDEIIQKIESK